MFEFITPYLFDMGLWLCEQLGNVAESFPEIPSDIALTFENYFNLLFSKTGLLGVFVDLDYVLAISPFLIAVLTGDKALKLGNWVYKHLPINLGK